MLIRRFVSLRVACVKSYHARPKAGVVRRTRTHKFARAIFELPEACNKHNHRFIARTVIWKDDFCYVGYLFISYFIQFYIF